MDILAAAVPPPEELRPFQLGESIGKGGFGVVYKGLNTETGDFVAIKVISLSNVPKQKVAEFMGEFKLLENLDHPNVVKYFGVRRSHQYLTFFIEFVENGSLQQLVKKFGKVSEGLAANYIAQILGGLNYLHSLGVVHRDIKGSNILLTKEGKVKICDFGVSTLMLESMRKTTVVGTPFWMAPEVISMSGQRRESDIWSVGCTAIELMTGSPPFSSLTPMSALFRMVDDPHPPLPEELSESCRDFLLGCFVKDVDKRPSAEALLQHPWIVQNASPDVLAAAVQRSSMSSPPPPVSLSGSLAVDRSPAGSPLGAEGRRVGQSFVGPAHARSKSGHRHRTRMTVGGSPTTPSDGGGGGSERVLRKKRSGGDAEAGDVEGKRAWPATSVLASEEFRELLSSRVGTAVADCMSKNEAREELEERCVLLERQNAALSDKLVAVETQIRTLRTAAEGLANQNSDLLVEVRALKDAREKEQQAASQSRQEAEERGAAAMRQDLDLLRAHVRQMEEKMRADATQAEAKMRADVTQVQEKMTGAVRQAALALALENRVAEAEAAALRGLGHVRELQASYTEQARTLTGMRIDFAELSGSVQVLKKEREVAERGRAAAGSETKVEELVKATEGLKLGEQAEEGREKTKKKDIDESSVAAVCLSGGRGEASVTDAHAKRSGSGALASDAEIVGGPKDEASVPHKKKKKVVDAAGESAAGDAGVEDEASVSHKQKKKKVVDAAGESAAGDAGVEDEASVPHKKKKKVVDAAGESAAGDAGVEDEASVPHKKKKKKVVDAAGESAAGDAGVEDEASVSHKKKKKKVVDAASDPPASDAGVDQGERHKSKKHAKKRLDMEAEVDEGEEDGEGGKASAREGRKRNDVRVEERPEVVNTPDDGSRDGDDSEEVVKAKKRKKKKKVREDSSGAEVPDAEKERKSKHKRTLQLEDGIGDAVPGESDKERRRRLRKTMKPEVLSSPDSEKERRRRQRKTMTAATMDASPR